MIGRWEIISKITESFLGAMIGQEVPLRRTMVNILMQIEL
jgi:hypothetical protein